jgi:hypothetical protein
MDYNNNLEEALLSKKERVEDEKVYNNLDINLKEWNDDIEDLLKCWGEKSGGLAILHNKVIIIKHFITILYFNYVFSWNNWNDLIIVTII